LNGIAEKQTVTQDTTSIAPFLCVVLQGSFPQIWCIMAIAVCCVDSSVVIFYLWWFWYVAALWCCIQGWVFGKVM